MAEQIISPGVFTRENDQSFLPQGVGAIGAAIVGPTVKGPAFVPTVVRSFTEYERRFGGLSKDTFVPQTVREYLRNAGSVTVTRVLAGGGYKFTNGTTEPLAIIAHNGEGTGTDKLATSSIVFNQTPNNANSTNGVNDQFIIDNTTFIFVESTLGYTQVPQQGSFGVEGSTPGQVFVDAGAEDDIAGAVGNFYTAYTAYKGDIPLTITRDTTEPQTKIMFSGSVAGTSGNVRILSGSFVGFPIGAANTFTIPLESADAKLGGTDAVATEKETNVLLGIIYPSKHPEYPNLNKTQLVPHDAVPAVDESFELKIASNDGAGSVTIREEDSFTGTLNPADSKYLFKQIGTSPDNSKTAVDEYNGIQGYVETNFKSFQTLLQSSADLNSSGYNLFSSHSQIKTSFLKSSVSFNGLGNAEGYSYASTPFITSQIDLGEKQLFRLHSLGHGNECNTDYKVSITNLKEPSDIDGIEQYSTFTVLIRKYNDSDKKMLIQEEYTNCNLDPDSPNYIARVIGDRYPQYNDTLGKVELLGNYPTVSQLCRVEVSDQVAEKAISPKLSPKGFEVVSNPLSSQNFSTDFHYPSASYEGAQEIGGNYNSRAFLGWKFDEKEIDNKNFLKPIDSSNQANVAGNFNVDNYKGHANSGLWIGSLSASIDSTGVNGPTPNQLKFTTCFQGGFDGIAPYQVKFVGNESSLHGTYENGTNLCGFDMSNGEAGSEGYKKALDILSNQDEYDINMVALPGVIKSLHPIVTNAAIDMCEERGDAFYVMDLSQYNNSVNQAINAASGLDTNYAAVYYPWVKVNGPSGTPILVPPSVIVPGAIAASDRIAAEWFAPAGLNRGVLGNVIEAKIRLNQAERDRLYNAKINPIATFPQTGVCIWGQKTLQERSTALDRINVRRLLIALKKFIASSSRYLVFEQNTNATRNRFLNIVNPYLESVQQRQGLYSFRVQMDEANNTADVVDRNQLVGAVYLQPTKTAEFIVLDFNVLPTGATFDGNGGGGY
jgi:hypothetical protein